MTARLLCGAATLLAAVAPRSMAQGCAQDLTGVWGAQVSFGPLARGTLTVTHVGTWWTASLAGIDAPVRVARDSLSFQLAGGELGSFRGRFVHGEASIRGQWVQPMTTHVWGARYATPVELHDVAPGLWSGIVAPLEDAESVYLVVSRDSAGREIAFIRNPERNLGRVLGSRQVRCNGNRVELSRTESDSEPLYATLHPSESVLSLYLPTESATFDLTRQGAGDASDYYPRAGGNAGYVYHKPVTRDDGWPTASLADVGIREQPVLDLVRSIIRTPTASVDAPYVQAFLLARQGKLVLEEYFYGFDRDRVHDTRSAGKTITTTLAGILARSGAIGLHTKVVDLFPHEGQFQHDGPDKRAITVENLLTMTSGFDADDDNGATPGTEDRLVEHGNRYRFTLNLPMAYAPGTHAIYSAAGINLLGGVVQQVSHEWVPEFMYDSFARPLDIHHYHVPLDSAGNAYMAGGVQMRPRDFLKLGQLFLSHGRWHGREIVSADWVDDATRTHAHMGPGDYGFGWWLRDVRVGLRTYHTYRAAGNGGQMVIVIPDLDLVVLFMGGNYGQGPVWYPWNDVWLPQVIIPAAAP